MAVVATEKKTPEAVEASPPPPQVVVPKSSVKYRDALQEIECLIKGRHPLIYVVTHEEKRFVEELYERIVRPQGREFFLWSQYQGITPYSPKKPPARCSGEWADTNTSVKALTKIEEYSPDASPGPDGKAKVRGCIFLMRDMHITLVPPAPRQIRDIYEHLITKGKTLVIVAPLLAHGANKGIEPTLEKQMAVVHYALPGREQIEVQVRGIISVIKNSASAHKAKLDYTDQEFFQFSRALQGLTALEVDHALAASITHLHRLDVDKLVLEKRQIVKKSEILEFIDADTTTQDIGGMDNAKAFFDTYGSAFSPEAIEFGVEPLTGVLLTGIPGTGKSQLAKAVGNLWKVPTLRLDVGKVMTGLVGGSVRGSEEVVWFEKTGRSHRNTIKELVEAAPADCWVDTYTDEGQQVRAQVTGFIPHRLQPQDKLYQLVMQDGRSIVTTGDHGVFRASEVLQLETVRVDNLKSGDFLAAPGSLITTGLSVQGGRALGFLAGAWLGDGDYNAKDVRYHLNKKDVESFSAILDAAGYNHSVYDSSSSEQGAVLHVRGLQGRLQEMGFHGDCHTKRVPEEVFGMSQDFIRGLLAGYFSTDGSFTGHVLEASSVSRALRDDIAHLLHRVGIKACISEKVSESGYRKVPGTDYIVRVSGEADLAAFTQRVGMAQDYKAEALGARMAVNAHGYYVPLTEELKAEIHSARRAMWSRYQSRPYNFDHRADAIGLGTLVKIQLSAEAGGLPSSELPTISRALSQDLRWVRVSEVTEVPREPGEEYVYDISVPGSGYEKFIAGSCPMLVHNSEQKMREVIGQAEAMSPCCLWIDEVEKSLSGTKSSNFSDAGTLSRVFGTLLTAMQEGLKGVTVVATANDITALPPEFIRRFNEVFFVDLPTPEERKEIFEIHLRKRKRNPADFDLTEPVKASRNFTGAEIEKAVKEAIAQAWSDGSRPVTVKDLVDSIGATKPIYKVMNEKVTQIRDWARGRARYASSQAEKANAPGAQSVTTAGGKEMKLDEALEDLGQETQTKMRKKKATLESSPTARATAIAESLED